MTSRQKRNAIIWPIVGGIPLLIILVFIILAWSKSFTRRKKIEKIFNTYNVKYSSNEPLMEFVRKSKEETESDNGFMYGYIYIDGEKKDFKCMFAARHRVLNRMVFWYIDSDERIFEAYYNLKGNDLILTPYFSDYVVGEYKTITLTKTDLN